MIPFFSSLGFLPPLGIFMFFWAFYAGMSAGSGGNCLGLKMGYFFLAITWCPFFLTMLAIRRSQNFAQRVVSGIAAFGFGLLSLLSSLQFVSEVKTARLDMLYLGYGKNSPIWFEQGRVLNPLIARFIAEKSPRMSFPNGDDEVLIDGLVPYLQGCIGSERGRKYFSGGKIIDPWGDSVVVVFDHNHDMRFAARSTSREVCAPTGNYIAVGLLMERPETKIPYGYSRSCWSIDGGVIATK